MIWIETKTEGEGAISKSTSHTIKGKTILGMNVAALNWPKE